MNNLYRDLLGDIFQLFDLEELHLLADVNKFWNQNMKLDCKKKERKSDLWEIVQANPDKPWDYYWLSENPNITWEIVQANSDKPWRYDWMSENYGITWK